MRKLDQYLSTIDTMYPDGHARESFFRDAGDMLDPATERQPSGNLLRRLFEGYVLWRQKREGRRVLRDLTDDQLRDIGVTRQEAGKEVAKSRFWD